MGFRESPVRIRPSRLCKYSNNSDLQEAPGGYTAGRFASVPPPWLRLRLGILLVCGNLFWCVSAGMRDIARSVSEVLRD